MSATQETADAAKPAKKVPSGRLFLMSAIVETRGTGAYYPLVQERFDLDDLRRSGFQITAAE